MVIKLVATLLKKIFLQTRKNYHLRVAIECFSCITFLLLQFVFTQRLNVNKNSKIFFKIFIIGRSPFIRSRSFFSTKYSNILKLGQKYPLQISYTLPSVFVKNEAS